MLFGTTSLSAFKDECRRARPSFLTASNTTSLSAFNSLDACCSEYPLFLTTANISSLSAFNAADAYCKEV